MQVVGEMAKGGIRGGGGHCIARIFGIKGGGGGGGFVGGRWFFICAVGSDTSCFGSISPLFLLSPRIAFLSLFRSL